MLLVQSIQVCRHLVVNNIIGTVLINSWPFSSVNEYCIHSAADCYFAVLLVAVAQRSKLIAPL